MCNVINNVACALQIPINLIFLTKDEIQHKLTQFTAQKLRLWEATWFAQDDMAPKGQRQLVNPERSASENRP